ncbi:MAG: hypothetical protein ACPGXY_00830 [Alphaproteobacteria bacterium]
MTLGFLLVGSSYAATVDDQCRLFEKQRDLLVSKLELAKAQYKAYFKRNLLPRMKIDKNGNKNVSIPRNNKYVKAIANYSLVATTYEALVEGCQQGISKNTGKNMNMSADSSEPFSAVEMVPIPNPKTVNIP